MLYEHLMDSLPSQVQQAEGNEKLVESMGSVKAARLLHIIHVPPCYEDLLGSLSESK